MSNDYTISLAVKANTSDAKGAISDLSAENENLARTSEAAGQKESELGKNIDSATKSAEGNAAQVDTATKSLDSMKGAADDLSKNVESTTKTVDGMKDSADGLSDAVENAAKTAADTQDALADLAGETDTAAAAVDSMKSAADDLSKNVESTTESVTDLGSAQGDLAGQMGDTAGSVSDAAATLTDLGESASEAGEQAADLSETLADAGASIMDLSAAEAEIDATNIKDLSEAADIVANSTENAAQKQDTFAEKIAATKARAEEAEKSIRGLGDIATGAFLGVTGALLATGAAVGTVTKQGVDLSLKLENTVTAIKSLKGESFDTEQFMEQLAKTSADTGTSMQDLADAGLALARANADVGGSLDYVNTLATATQKDTAHTAEVFARALSGNAGALRELAHGYGISTEELSKYGAELDKNGQIASDTAEQQKKLEDALKSIIDTKYADAIEQHGATLQGALEDLSSTMDRLKTSIGESVQEPLKNLVNALTGFLDIVEAAPDWMKKAAVAMGGIGTAMLLATAACWGVLAAIGKMYTGFVKALDIVGKLSGGFDTFLGIVKKTGDAYRFVVDSIKLWLTKMTAVKTAKEVDTTLTEANTAAVGLNTAAVEANVVKQGLLVGMMGKLKVFWLTYYQLIGAVVVQFGLLAEAALAAYEYYKLYREVEGWAEDETRRGQEVSKDIQEATKSLRAGRGAARRWEETQQKYGVTGQSAEQKARELYSRGASREEIAEIYRSQQAYAQVLLRASKEENASIQSKIAADNAKTLSTELGKVVREMDKIAGFKPKNAGEQAADSKNIDENLKKQLAEIEKQGEDGKKSHENIEKILKSVEDINKTQKSDKKEAKKEEKSKEFKAPDIASLAIDYPTAKKREAAKAAAAAAAVPGAAATAEKAQHSPAMAYAIATGRPEDFQRALLMEGAYTLKSGGYGPNAGTFNPETYDWRDEKRKSIEEMDKQREAWDRYIHGTPAEEAEKSAADGLKSVSSAADQCAGALTALYQAAQQQANPQNVQNNLTINSQNAVQNSNTDAIWRHFEEFMKQQNAQKSAFSSVTNN